MKPSTFNSFLGGLKTNIAQGNRISQRLIILESDDWGAIRTPSQEVLESYRREGMDLSGSIYQYDALESEQDLEELFNVLLSIKNNDGQHPKFTANAIVANPDFDKIAESNFEQYFYEPVSETFKGYPNHHNSFNLWHKGNDLGIFRPQFHGREHLNIERWLGALRVNDKGTMFSFKLGSTYSGKNDYSYMEAFDWSSPVEIEHHKHIIHDGLNLFEQLLGYRSKTFIAPCYNWDEELEPILLKSGVNWVQGLKYQLAPTGKFDHYHRIPHKFGVLNPNGLRYNVRNTFFEPSSRPNYNWVDMALAKISAAFLMQRPAVISTHRINYIGFINKSNRENGLRQLSILLKEVIKRWPDVRFISTDELSNYC
jgi:hypothetical protein